MTLDNYIMESEINDATVGDIYVEQALAEMEVAYALASSYIKDSMYVEYLAEMNGMDVQTYMESGDDTDLSDKKSIGERIKSGASAVGKFFKSIAVAILTALSNFWHFITEKSLKTCIKKLEQYDTGKIWNLPVPQFRDNEYILELSNEFCKLVHECVDGNSTARGEFQNIYHRLMDPKEHRKDLNETRYELKANMIEISTADLREELIRWTNDDVKKRLSNAMKAYKSLIKYLDADDKSRLDKKSDSYKDDKRAYKIQEGQDKQTLRLVKETGKALTKAWANCLRDTRQVANKILKQEKEKFNATYKASKKHGNDVDSDDFLKEPRA